MLGKLLVPGRPTYLDNQHLQLCMARTALSDSVIKHPVWSISVETRTRIGPLRSDRVIKHPMW